jgi:hypothetical protein
MIYFCYYIYIEENKKNKSYFSIDIIKINLVDINQTIYDNIYNNLISVYNNDKKYKHIWLWLW